MTQRLPCFRKAHFSVKRLKIPQSGTKQNTASYTKEAEMTSFFPRYTEVKPCKVLKFFLQESVFPSFLDEALTISSFQKKKKKKDILPRGNIFPLLIQSCLQIFIRLLDGHES